MIRLMALDNRRTVSPVDINTDHIVSVTPRKQFKPSANQQNPYVSFAYEGSTVTLANGDRHSVVENVEDIWKLSGITVKAVNAE